MAWYTPPVQTTEKTARVADNRYAAGNCWVLCVEKGQLCGMLYLSGTGASVTVTAFPAQMEIVVGQELTGADAYFSQKGASALAQVMCRDRSWIAVDETGAERLVRYLSYGVVVDGKTVTAVQVRQRWRTEYAQLTAAVLQQYLTKDRNFDADYKELTACAVTNVDIAAFTAAKATLAGWTDKNYMVRAAPGQWVGTKDHPRFVRKGGAP